MYATAHSRPCLLQVKCTVICRPELEVAVMHPSQRVKMMRRSFLRGKSGWQIVITCLMVVVYFLYPTLIRQVATLNHCNNYDFEGSGVPPSLLSSPSP